MRTYMKPIAVEETYGLSRSQLAQLRFKGNGPRYYKPTPKTVYYLPEDIEAWIDSSARSGTQEASWG